MAHLNGNAVHGTEDENPTEANSALDVSEAELNDELILDLTDPDVAEMVDQTVQTFQQLELEHDDEEMAALFNAIYETYEQSEDEFVLRGDAIPVFVSMVYELASMIDDGELEMEGTDEYLEIANDFLGQIESVFPDIIADLEAETDDEDEDDDEKEDDSNEDDDDKDKDDDEAAPNPGYPPVA